MDALILNTGFCTLCQFPAALRGPLRAKVIVLVHTSVLVIALGCFWGTVSDRITTVKTPTGPRSLRVNHPTEAEDIKVLQSGYARDDTVHVDAEGQATTFELPGLWLVWVGLALMAGSVTNLVLIPGNPKATPPAQPRLPDAAPYHRSGLGRVRLGCLGEVGPQGTVGPGHLVRARGLKRRRVLWLAVGGFVVVIFTFYGVNLLLSGLHSYA